MLWPKLKKHRGIVFEFKYNGLYKGVSKEGLFCYLIESKNTITGSTGYVIIPNSLNKTDKKLTELITLDSYVNVHGGITFIEDKFLDVDIGEDKDVIVLGFDTSHGHSPRIATIEFMIDEVLKLSRWAFAVVTNNESYFDKKIKLIKNEDYFSCILRSIEDAGRKIILPDEQEFNEPRSYIEEVFRRIEDGYTPDEKFTEEDKKIDDQEKFSMFREAFGSLLKNKI